MSTNKVSIIALKIRIRLLLSFMLTASILMSLFVPLSAFAEDSEGITDLTLDAKAAVLVDAESGEAIFSQNADTQLFAGGTAVVMTALLAFEAIDSGNIALSDSVTAPQDIYFDIPSSVVTNEETKAIQPGETISLEDLLYIALIGSSNEACNVIGEYVAGGSINSFIDMMNKRAEELGCTNTHFINTHGLPGGGQYSTARDLATISREAVKHEKFMEICDSVSIEIGATNISDTRYVTNSNYLIRPDKTRYYYSSACGIKNTGTESQGYSLISAVDVDGKYVISVVLGTWMIQADKGYYDIQSFVQTKKLFKWFFDNYSYKAIVSPIEPIIEVPIKLGEGADSVVAKAETGFSMFLPKNLDLSNAFTRNVTIYSMQNGAKPLKAPVSAGTVLGQMTITFEGKELGPFNLVATTNVNISKYEQMKENVTEVFHNPFIALAFWVFILIIALYIVLVIRYNLARAKKRKSFNDRNANSVITIPRKKL